MQVDARFFEENREELVALLCRLVEQDTTNPPGNEHLAAEVVKKYFDRHHIQYVVREKTPGRTNVVATVGRGRPRVLVAAHLDVVPAGDGWDTEPFKPVHKGDEIYGRGTSDNKGQLASMMLVARYLREHEAEFSGQFILVAAADEEIGSVQGLDYLVKENLVDADVAVIPDSGGNMRRVVVGEKGLLRITVASHGKQAHGSRPEKGFNAIWPMITFLNLLRQEKFFADAHPAFTPPTMNLGVMKGGVAANVVPAKCVAEIDFRFLPGREAKDIVGRVKALARKAQEQEPLSRLEIENVSSMTPFVISPEHPMVQVIRKRAKEMLGVEPALEGMSGTTVSKQLLSKGITSLGFSCGDSDKAHMANESISVAEMVDFAKVMTGIIADYCEQGKPGSAGSPAARRK
jgi:acetylornithine deacetylase/succinyl-diaminopimelate desuccinylase family protein